MSEHSNKRGAAPSSSRTKIRGDNPTYKSSVQEESSNEAETNQAGEGSATEKVEGEGSIPTESGMPSEEGTSYGSGHYKPAK